MRVWEERWWQPGQDTESNSDVEAIRVAISRQAPCRRSGKVGTDHERWCFGIAGEKPPACVERLGFVAIGVAAPLGMGNLTGMVHQVTRDDGLFAATRDVY